MSANEPPESRSKILRDVFVFQVKLWLEGFKDVVLIPLSLGAACVDLVFRRSSRKGTLYSVMKLGDQFERWVDLYAPLDHQQDEHRSPTVIRPNVDDLMDEAEAGLRKASFVERQKSTSERNQS